MWVLLVNFPNLASISSTDSVDIKTVLAAYLLLPALYQMLQLGKKLHHASGAAI
jgi:hypothetical protein